MSRSENGSTRSPAAPELTRFLADCAGRVEAFLDGVLPPETGSPRPLAAAVRYAALGGGKRIRPALAIASALTVGGRARDALAVAGAVEMVHTYSLIHDDLPCMDDDDLRRGRPAVHIRFGEAMAVLAGDALHTLAFLVLAESPGPPEIRIEWVRRLAEAAGPAGMVGGQVLDLEAETRTPDARGLESIHRAKTGALFGASAALGALAGGGGRAQVEALAGFGRELGLVFQIVDDLLDEEQTSDTLGKSAGKDRAAGKATYPGIHGRAGARAEALRRTGAARRILEELGSRAGEAVSPDGLRLLGLLADGALHRSA